MNPILILFALLAGLAAPACGGSQSSRAATTVAIDSAILRAEGALRSYDHQRTEALIASLKPPVTAEQAVVFQAAVAKHRTQVDKVQLALDAARLADDAARQLNDAPSITNARTALSDALTALTLLTGGKL